MVIGEIRPSMAIIYNGDLYTVLSCEHAKVARGAAFCRVKLKNMKTDQTKECTLRDSDNVEKAYIEKRTLQYVYHDGNLFHFLAMDTYEDMILTESHIGDKAEWLKDNLPVTGLFYENKLLDFELPSSMELKVVETDPGFRGDTVKAGTKSAKLETGVKVNVPLFINTGEIIKVDTRTKEYISRA
jgi:elongation factor P